MSAGMATAFRSVTLRTPLSRARYLSSLPPSLQEAKDMLRRDKALLVDVREPEEWHEGHFANAMLVPYKSQLASGNIPRELKDTQKKIYLHCKAGGRAALSAEILKEAGCDAVPFDEGFAELAEFEFGDVV